MLLKILSALILLAALVGFVFIIIDDATNGPDRLRKIAKEEADRIASVPSFIVIKETNSGTFILEETDTRKRFGFTACTPEQLGLGELINKQRAVSFKTKDYDESNVFIFGSDKRVECLLAIK